MLQPHGNRASGLKSIINTMQTQETHLFVLSTLLLRTFANPRSASRICPACDRLSDITQAPSYTAKLSYKHQKRTTASGSVLDIDVTRTPRSAGATERTLACRVRRVVHTKPVHASKQLVLLTIAPTEAAHVLRTSHSAAYPRVMNPTPFSTTFRCFRSGCRRLTLGVQEYVFRLEIPVYDAVLVEVFECQENLMKSPWYNRARTSCAAYCSYEDNRHSTTNSRVPQQYL